MPTLKMSKTESVIWKNSLREREETRVAANGGSVHGDGLLRGKAMQVMRSACFRSRTGQPHAPEGLHTHDSTDHVSIHVHVTDARTPGNPFGDRVDARVHAERQPVTLGIH